MNTHIAGNHSVFAVKSLASTKDLALDKSLRHATNEALALAWTTPYPEFVLPVLLEEKLAAARRYSERQHRVRYWSREMLREMGWRDAARMGGNLNEADRMLPMNLAGRRSIDRFSPVAACVCL